MARRTSALATACALVAGSLLAGTRARADVLPVAPDRAVEPVVLTGLEFPGWSAGPEITARLPTTTLNSDCPNDPDGLNHNCSQPSQIPNNPRRGVDVHRLIGYRWDDAAASFVQIPFQVDERFTRYISNLASNCNRAGPLCVGFGSYAGADAQLSYAFDRDGYKFTAGTCTAEMPPGTSPDPDPIPGLDDNDELAFLYRDTGPQAPPDAPLPTGIIEMRAIRIDDPAQPLALPRFAYVGLSTGAVRPAYDATNGYMRYVRDADADRYEQTSANYGNAPKGVVCDDAGRVIATNVPRRPRDTAWVLTPRYAFRYAGRWTLRGMRVAPGDRTRPLDDPSQYGPPLLDQWKARAYAQTPRDETPCCGFETEDGWNRSSVTLGERWGPVRVIRSTWGSDSGTNTVRTEIFYPDLVLQQTNLRVHPIPPLGGIFSYWDHTAGVVTRYYNPERPQGVAVDGHNDEVVGTGFVAVRQGGAEIRDDDPLPVLGPQDVRVGSQGACVTECTNLDLTDPTLNATGTLAWEEVSGPYGSMVFRTHLNQITPGDVQSFAAIPYYRDDACFDDGTGVDPGPAQTSGEPSRPCWRPGEPAPEPGLRQGLIGAHGVQVLFAAETDNLELTVPVDEISAETRIVVLPGDQGNVGDRYGFGADLPLVATPSLAPPPDRTTLRLDGDSSGRIGGRARLEATLTDALGPVAKATIHLTFQGVTYSAATGSDGRAVVNNIPIAPPAGLATVTATYDGDGLLRAPSFARSSFDVKRSLVSLDFTAASTTSAVVHHQASFEARLADPAPVAGATLRFTFQKATYEARTNEDGTAAVPVTVSGPAGPTPLRVDFEGDATHEAASTSTTVTVEKDAAALAFTQDSSSSARVHHTAHLAARLRDSAGPVAGAAVLFELEGASARATTGADGVAEADVLVTGPAGHATARASFAGDDEREPATATSDLTIDPDATELRFESDSASTGTIGDPVTFVARLADSAGPVGGASVTFDYAGRSYEAVTGDGGRASVTVTVAPPAGDQSVAVSFAGDDSRGPSESRSTFHATARRSAISFVAQPAPGKKVRVEVELSDPATSRGIAGRTVEVFVNDRLLATVTTARDGSALAIVKVASPRGKTFRVTFAGDETYAPVSAEGRYGRGGATGSS